MESLVRGIHQFQAVHFQQHRELFEQLTQGQHPETLLITCSDSRIHPSLLLQNKPGELFVLRNAGNIVPPYGAVLGGEAATVEFALAALNVRHIVVMGHSHCGAMKGLLNPPDLAAMPLVEAWLKHAAATAQIVRENYPDCHGQDLLNAAIKENVIVQLTNLCTYPAVAARLAQGKLALHAWVYHLEHGQILGYDASLSKFVPVTERYERPALTQRPVAERTTPVA
jgi:carbonic anhydrase